MVPGIKAKHAIVTPNCRKLKGDDPAISEALERLREECKSCMSFEANQGANFHFVLTVERPKP